MVNRLILLSNTLNKTLRNGVQIGEQVAQLKWQFLDLHI